MADNTLIETTSPIDAANGVAKLSGFILQRCENIITAIITKSKKEITILEKTILFLKKKEFNFTLVSNFLKLLLITLFYE